MIGVYAPNRPGFPWSYVLPMSALILVLVGAASIWFSRRLARPLDQLASAARQFGAGDTAALDFYTPAGRITGGSHQAMTDAAYAGWHADMTAGRHSILVAATNADVAALSARARPIGSVSARSSRTGSTFTTAPWRGAGAGSFPAPTHGP